MNALTLIILGVHWIVAIAVTARIVARRGPVGSSLAWLAVVFATPGLGVGLYLLIGERRTARSRQPAVEASNEAFRRWCRTLPEFDIDSLWSNDTGLASFVEEAVHTPVMRAPAPLLVDTTEGFFTALETAIASARERVDIEVYIWDSAGRVGAIETRLIEAAERGVPCRLLVDAVGSRPFLRGDRASVLRAAGVEVVASLPLRFLARIDLRNHRKILIVDDMAWMGSHNMVDPAFFKTEAGVGRWIDASLRLEGLPVHVLGAVLESDRAVELGTASTLALPAADVSPHGEPTPPPGAVAMQVMPSGPEDYPEVVHQVLLTLIYAAIDEVVITTPYFVPDEALLNALVTATMRGVRVTLVTPAKNDSRLVEYASASAFDRLLRHGVRLGRYRAGLLHTKSVTVDGRVSMVGSVNFDLRSVYLNKEVSLLVYDRSFTEEMRALQTEYLAESDLVDETEWRTRGWRQRALENTARLIGPLL